MRILFSLFPTRLPAYRACLLKLLISGSQSRRIRRLGGDYDEQEGEKNKGGDRGAKQHKGAKMLNH